MFYHSWWVLPLPAGNPQSKKYGIVGEGRKVAGWKQKAISEGNIKCEESWQQSSYDL